MCEFQQVFILSQFYLQNLLFKYFTKKNSEFNLQVLTKVSKIKNLN